MDVEIFQGDITTVKVDAIVNAANSSLLGGGGVDGAIHRAGGPDILSECRQLRASTYPDGLPTGEAAATTAGALAANCVIHTVGPVYSAHEDRSQKLRDCYRNSLECAQRLGAESIAFPLISSGVYRWPKPEAIDIALRQLGADTGSVPRRLLVLFDTATYDAAHEAHERLRTGYDT